MKIEIEVGQGETIAAATLTALGQAGYSLAYSEQVTGGNFRVEFERDDGSETKVRIEGGSLDRIAPILNADALKMAQTIKNLYKDYFEPLTRKP